MTTKVDSVCIRWHRNAFGVSHYSDPGMIDDDGLVFFSTPAGSVDYTNVFERDQRFPDAYEFFIGMRCAATWLNQKNQRE